MQITKVSMGRLVGIAFLIALIALTVFNVLLYLESRKWHESQDAPISIKAHSLTLQLMSGSRRQVVNFRLERQFKYGEI
jgi:hypothetical protein